MDRKLKLATWNANGLAKHSLEVKAFILSHDIDILLVSETHSKKIACERVFFIIILKTITNCHSTFGNTFDDLSES